MIELVDLHDEHPRPFDVELIRLGLRWRDFPHEGFTWADLAAIIACADPEGPLGMAVNPAGAVTVDQHFLRSIEHSARWLVWSKTTDAKSGRPPEAWRFAWEDNEDVGYRTDALTVSEVNAFLGWEEAIGVENERRAAAGLPLIPTT